MDQIVNLSAQSALINWRERHINFDIMEFHNDTNRDYHETVTWLIDSVEKAGEAIATASNTMSELRHAVAGFKDDKTLSVIGQQQQIDSYTKPVLNEVLSTLGRAKSTVQRWQATLNTAIDERLAFDGPDVVAVEMRGFLRDKNLGQVVELCRQDKRFYGAIVGAPVALSGVNPDNVQMLREHSTDKRLLAFINVADVAITAVDRMLSTWKHDVSMLGVDIAA